MPIETNSDAWKNGADIDRLHKEILDFLQSNPNKAFHEREITDEVTGSDWEAAHESERLRQQLSEEEYNNRMHNDNLPDSDIPLYFNQFQILRTLPAIMKLLDENEIQQRKVDADGFGFPYDWDTVVAYSYSGE